ncbi:hypothetical protein B0T16DRAFT_345371 [Cercophora newfieldiana]|uniref:Protein required for cell viability n=1 Tax=Cercophora newfieldiana TaxID=92897 RepID=A0AA39YF67_9PEZI|nr:hypothetical protein B0T16DRAFT_345371 [Cercophora newfieldiana]
MDEAAMDQPAPPQNARQRLMQSLMELGNKAFNPDASESSRVQAQREFSGFVERTKTLNIIAAFNILIRPGHVPPWLRSKLMEILTLVPLRPDGVRATLEFVFSVHPSSTVKVSEAAVPQKRGANITHEALEMASRLISTPPASVTPDVWYAGVAPQLLRLLDGDEGPELRKAVAYIIGFGVLGRKTSGAPGTAGWKLLAEPILHSIRPPPGATESENQDGGGDVIIDLSKDRVLVTPHELATALSRLQSLVVSHPNPGLCKRLLSPLLLPLWALSSWGDAGSTASEKSRATASELLKIQLKLTPSPDILLMLVHNVGYLGGYDRQNPEWVYAANREGELQIVIRRSFGPTNAISLEQIDSKIKILLKVVEDSFSSADISTVFIDFLGRWLKSARGASTKGVVIKEEADGQKDPVKQLTEVKLLQAMMEKFPEKLANQPKHILELVSQILTDTGDIPESDDDVVGVALSLLNMIVTAPGFQKSRVNSDTMNQIEASLADLSRGSRPEVSSTARNLSLLLKYRDQLNDPTETTTTTPTDRQIEDRKTYQLAVSYITQPDSPPPVKFEGLNLLSTLITAQSPILDIPGILVLLSSLFADGEDYINLKAITLYTLLSHKHPNAVTKELLDHYVDAKETASVDTRLRFGEALLRVIERLGETFTASTATTTADALLLIAGRRGYRPKTQARQAKEERRRQMKIKEAEEAWDGEVPDLSDDVPEEEQKRNEILARIVEGWESKRGAEDVRIRASALSILGAAMETNISGLGPSVVAMAVDLALSIVQVETEDEKGILRRAAVLLVMSFVRALDAAKKMGRRLGFGLAAKEDVVRVLGYVRETDGDGLVREYARDVMESLENWEMGRLVPVEEGGGAGVEGLGRLKGLEVDLERAAEVKREERKARPRIEEIE